MIDTVARPVIGCDRDRPCLPPWAGPVTRSANRGAPNEGEEPAMINVTDRWHAWLDTHYDYDRHGYLPECSSEALEEFAANTPGVTGDDIERLLADALANL